MDAGTAPIPAAGRDSAGGAPARRATRGRHLAPAGPGVARVAAGTALSALLALSLVACGGSGGPSAPASASAPGSGSAIPATGDTAAGTGAPQGPEPNTGGRGVGTCPSSSLAAKIQDTEGAAGTVYYEMALTNIGSKRCALEGYPGVSLLDAAGRQLGAPADREPAGQPPGAAGASGGRIALAPGGLLVFTVLVTQPGVLPGCLTPDTFGKAFTMQIYPPDNTVSLQVALAGGQGAQACAAPSVHELKVTTVGAV